MGRKLGGNWEEFATCGLVSKHSKGANGLLGTYVYLPRQLSLRGQPKLKRSLARPTPNYPPSTCLAVPGSAHL